MIVTSAYEENDSDITLELFDVSEFENVNWHDSCIISTNNYKLQNECMRSIRFILFNNSVELLEW